MLDKNGYEQTLARVDFLMGLDPEPESTEGRELIALVDQVLEYELKHFPILFEEDPKACTDGGEHDWSGPLYERLADGGIPETGPTCIKCKALMGVVHPPFPT